MKKRKEFILIKGNGENIKILWDGYIELDNSISILKYIENNSEKIKKKYISKIEEISFLRLNGKELHEIFSISEKFSYWWTTDIYEKSLYKQKSINEIIKLLALEEIINVHKPVKIIINYSSKKVFKCVKQICDINNIDLDVVLEKEINFKNFLIFKQIFYILNFLRFLSKRTIFNFFKIDKIEIKNLFCSYFTYIDFIDLKRGLYKSDYWGNLIEKKIIQNSHFLHIYFPSKKISYRDSVKAIKEINKKSNNTHFFIEELFSIKIFFKVIKFWFINNIKFYRYKKKIFENFLKKKIIFQSFFEDDFKEDICGTKSLINFYYFFLFEELSNRIRKIDKTFFLYENQGWEKSFVYNLKNIENNKIIGFQHSTVRFWDLRYNINTERAKEKIFTKFYPDYYAVNGEDSIKKMIMNGYPSHKLKKVEATRYSKIMQKLNSAILNKKKNNSILIIGDYSVESNLNISSSLNNLEKNQKSKFNFILKEHPLREMHSQLKFEFKKTKLSIADLSKEYSYAIVSNSTSAVIDLYLLGFKLIVIVDNDFVNFSPLKGLKDSLFLYNQNLLSNSLDEIDKNYELDKKKTNFFYYSPNYDLWNSLINKGV